MMSTEPAVLAEPVKPEVWHTWSAEEVLLHFRSSPEGLSAPEAARRLASAGLNELR